MNNTSKDLFFQIRLYSWVLGGHVFFGVGGSIIQPITIRKAVYQLYTGFPCGSGVKNPSANAEDAGLIPGSGRSPGGGNGNP